MKKIYNEPKACIVVMAVGDVIQTSSLPTISWNEGKDVTYRLPILDWNDGTE